MPRPSTIEQLDWQNILATGVEYDAWIASAEFEENAVRIETSRKAVTLTEDVKTRLAAIKRTVSVVAIAEDWCGDVIRHVPVLQKIADFCPQLVVKYVSRQQFPELFVRFLTNGGEAIPKCVFLSADLIECGNWGPMPHACREVIARGKACADVPSARQKVAALYAEDPNLEVVASELVHLIEVASTEAV